jgi:hypothetical protein
MAEAIILSSFKKNKTLAQMKPPDVITCKECKIPKPNTQFTKCTGNLSGRRAICKTCERERVEINKENKKEKLDPEVYFTY